ncbi:MAG: DUF3501 family protein [Gammaproteobacteria bacterium]
MTLKLTTADLLPLEQYHKQRPEFRQRLMVEKKRRRLDIGRYAHLYFENKVTMHYQVQEILRAEKIFEPEGIAEELAAYNPLIPDGDNFKATMMLQYTDINARRAALAELVGIEDHIWMKVAGFDAIYAIADEDMDRSTEDKTSAVHFLRFQFDAQHVAALKSGAKLAAGIDHARYNETVDPVPEELARALCADLA